MKRTLLLSLTLIFAFCGVVYASGVNGRYKGNAVIKVQYEGRTLTPDDVPGQMIDGRTMIPLSLLRKAGFIVDWDPKTLAANITTKKPEEPKTPLTVDQVKELFNAVAYISVYDEQGNFLGHGSGVVINSTGFIVTANHVAMLGGQYRELKVELNGVSYKIPKGQYVFADEKKDIYGFYIPVITKIPFIKVGSTLPKPSDDVYAMGNPKERRNEVSVGYVTAAYKENGRTYVNGIFPTEGGYSGGPLVNQYGEVVGVLTNGGVGDITITTSILDAKQLYESSFNQ